MIVVLIFAVVVPVASLVLLWRNEVTLRVRLDALALISREARLRILEGRYDDWRGLYERMNRTSYEATMFNFRATTPLKAFPWLVEEVRGELR